jgi:hypothetical protein
MFSGNIIGKRISPSRMTSMMAAIAIATGAKLKLVPEFANHLHQMRMHNFFLFNAEVEGTAIDGYKRMLALIDEIGEEQSFHPTICWDIRITSIEEKLHKELFLVMASWFAENDRPVKGLDQQQCRARIRDIVVKHTGALIPFTEIHDKEKVNNRIVGYWRKRVDDPFKSPKEVPSQLLKTHFILFFGEPMLSELYKDLPGLRWKAVSNVSIAKRILSAPSLNINNLEKLDIQQFRMPGIVYKLPKVEKLPTSKAENIMKLREKISQTKIGFMFDTRLPIRKNINDSTTRSGSKTSGGLGGKFRGGGGKGGRRLS